MIKFVSAGAILLTAMFSASAANLPVLYRISMDRANETYACGEEAAFTVAAIIDGGDLATHGRGEIVLDNFGPNVLKRLSVDFSKTNPVRVKGTRTTPGFLRLTVKDPDGKIATKLRGVPFDPLEIRQKTPCPDDFDAFWKDAIAKYDREIPEDIKLTKDESLSTAEYEFYRLSLSVPGGTKLYGQITIPTDKSRAPFPAKFALPGAGPSTLSRGGSPSMVSCYLNVHSYDPAAGDIRQMQLAEGAALRKRYPVAAKDDFYVYSVSGIGVSREDYFFYPVILGAHRTIEWLARQPFVDAKRIAYYGASQGGGLGLIVMGLSDKFARGTIGVPALCDLLCEEKDGESGAFARLVAAQLPENRARARAFAPYFDACNFARRIDVPVLVNVHFCDMACPPMTQFAGYNAIPSEKKRLMPCPGCGHGDALSDEVEKIEIFRYDFDAPTAGGRRSRSSSATSTSTRWASTTNSPTRWTDS